MLRSETVGPPVMGLVTLQITGDLVCGEGKPVVRGTYSLGDECRIEVDHRQIPGRTAANHAVGIVTGDAPIV